MASKQILPQAYPLSCMYIYNQIQPEGASNGGRVQYVV